MKRYIPLTVAALAILFAASTLRLPPSKSAFDTEGFGTMPILVNGRIKPLDTVARTTLLLLQNKQSFTRPDGTRIQPIEWLLDVFYRPELADTYQTIRIDHPEALALFGLTEADGIHFKFSFNQLRPGLAELERQADLAAEVEAPVRSPFQREVVKLRERLMLYHRLKHSLQLPDSPDFLAEILQFQEALPAGVAAARAKSTGEESNKAAFDKILGFANRFEFMTTMAYILPIPPSEGAASDTEWLNIGRALQKTFETQALDPHVMAYAGLGHSYRNNQPEQFNEIVRLQTNAMEARFADRLDRSHVEFRFNHAQPFYQASILLVLAFLLAVVSWLIWPDVLTRSAFWVAALACVLATAGIVTRMWLESRPPVTNLYSSALFVGWAAMVLGLVLERFFKNGIGTVTASAIGFMCLVIAHHLSFGGDTMEMMRAVLDSNFWLATHVVVITIGYSATFLAGFLGIFYVFLNAAQSLQKKKQLPLWVTLVGSVILSPLFLVACLMRESLRREILDALPRMVYGIICFATLFSLVGTILGGIWADQSWGRFWGWDPKENGALLIVLWNAVILHCRWGGLIKQRGLMNLAIFGNVVTAASWFGVNMLGVGLHSYGFVDAAFLWLMLFWGSQLAFIALGSLPLERWRSFKQA